MNIGEIMSNKENYSVLENNVRHTFMSIVWSHKIQEKQADILTRRYKNLEILRITCSALTSAGLISLIFTEQFLIKIVATIISFISTSISMFFQSFEIQKSITNHKNSATELLIIRNKFQLLLVEIKLRNKSEIEIVELYHQLVDKLADVYKTAPNTTNKAVKLAANALNVSKDNEFSDDEIDINLPDSLRRNAL